MILNSHLFGDSIDAVISTGLETGVRAGNAEDDLISLRGSHQNLTHCSKHHILLSCCVGSQNLIPIVRKWFQNLVVFLEQAWATSGPRATSSPRSTLRLPASYKISILDSNFYIENPVNFWLIIKITFQWFFFNAFCTYSKLKVNILAHRYLTCL